mgnify:CR=1 FL=1
MPSAEQNRHHALLPNWLTALLDGLYLMAGWLAGAFLVAIFLIMISLSAGRPLGIDVPAGDDFASWCMAACAFLALAHTFRSGELIRMELLIDRLGGLPRRLVEIICTALGTAASSYFAWYAIDMVLVSFEFNDMSQGVIAVPLWIPQLGMAAGLGILALGFIDELLHLLAGGAPRYEKSKPVTTDEFVERVMESGV